MFIYFLLLIVVEGCNILTLSGGGAHGAFQAGVLNRLQTMNKKWDIITGISVGSLNGIVLGMYTPSDQYMAMNIMRDVWLNITDSDVYSWNWDPFYDQSILDNGPLNNTIYSILYKYGGIAQRDILIGSVNLNTGLLRVFDKSELYSPARTLDIVMASSSIPVIFPPRFLDENYYVDGGTFSNEIVRPAIKFCLNNGYTKEDITIDIIICTPPISNITNSDIEKYHTYGIGSRAYDIVSSALSNHELYTTCSEKQEKYPMYIYKPYEPYSGSLLDFSHETLVKTFNMGYNIKYPDISNYCY
jgi:predicted patatin/cPLA2 family phospholipase